MNIFVLDNNPATAARFHNDRHCAKMILESCQLLSLVHVQYTGTMPKEAKLMNTGTRRHHTRHPCVWWAGTTLTNYAWLHALAHALTDEFAARYGHPHAYITNGVLAALAAAPVALRGGHLTPHVLCMPEYCKSRLGAVHDYRYYYIREKQHLAMWYGGDVSKVPEWYRFEGTRRD